MLDRICIDVHPKVSEKKLHDTALNETRANLPLSQSESFVSPMSLAMLSGKKWRDGRTLRIKFLNGSESMKTRCRKFAEKWLPFINLKFQWINAGDSEIRIFFAQDRGSWSYIGTDNLSIPQNEPTMQFGWLTEESTDTEFERVVVHEFGHAIGLIHEHQNPVENPIQWNEKAVISAYSGAPNYWDEEAIRRNILRRYQASQVNGSAFDPKSIMLYSFPASLTLNRMGTPWNTTLSEQDKRTISRLYPPQRIVVPRIKIGETVSGEFEIVGERDYYAFTATEEAFYDIETFGSTDTKLALYKEKNLIHSDLDSGTGANAKLRTILDPGDYLIILEHQKNGTGKYQIKVMQDTLFFPISKPNEIKKIPSIQDVAKVSLMAAKDEIYLNVQWQYERQEEAKVQFMMESSGGSLQIKHYAEPVLMKKPKSRNAIYKFNFNQLFPKNIVSVGSNNRPIFSLI